MRKYKFFESDGKPRVNIGESVFPIETDEQIKTVISKVLINQIKLDNTDRNLILEELRGKLKE